MPIGAAAAPRRRRRRGADSSDGGFSCGACGKVFLRLSSLQSHLPQHDGATTCPMCGRVYSNINSVRAHMKRCYREEKTQVGVEEQDPLEPEQFP